MTNKIIVTFGLHLDGQRAVEPANRLGETVVGPLGFLTVLETHTGLLALRPSQAERIVCYRDALAKADSPNRFYHASFETDALGTAARLLEWRDLWHLHGWSGVFAAGAGGRLADLADVEAIARDSLPPSIGERLDQVRCELERRQVPIGRVNLADPLAAFPRRWQVVLEKLPTHALTQTPAGRGFLGQIQKSLLAAAAGEPISKLEWDADGTVDVVQGESRFLAGAWLSALTGRSGSTLLVSGAEGERLDSQLSSMDYPRSGLREASAFRPALQVLPLALEIIWQPLNFYGLVQFLTHPVCPVPGYARRQLAAKVADAPGIGGTYWQRVLDQIDKHYGVSAAEVRAKTKLWIEHPRFSLEEGAPIDAVIERVRALVDFFRVRLGDADPARQLSFSAGFAQCRACIESLEGLQAQGVTVIRPRQLKTLVIQATANGTDNPLRVAEVGASLAITHPGAAVEAVDSVIWWQLVAPALPSSYPWSTAELRALAAAGAILPATEVLLAQVASEWLRPILAARESLTLVLPPAGDEVHPVWQMIEAVVGQPVVRALENLLANGGENAVPVACVPLAPPKRWWQLPEDVQVAMRPEESYSSLELMLFNPYHWVLKYPAKLRASRIVSSSGDFRMLGNLAHGLVESYYQRAEALTMSDDEFVAWYKPAFDRMVDEEGATLKMEGRGADLERFRHRLLQAMQALRGQFAQAGVTAVVPEMEVSGHFPGGRLSGSADLVADKGSAAKAIVDMKWSGVKKFPEKLKHNRHLQLAIYGELLRQKSGFWPSVAYYVLDRARFFAPDDTAFPNAEVVASDSGESTAQLWLRFIETWKWRKAQIESGVIELGLESIPETEESEPPPEAMAMEYLNEAYNDYRALAGWGN
jgi:hypothetical protein